MQVFTRFSQHSGAQRSRFFGVSYVDTGTASLELPNNSINLSQADLDCIPASLFPPSRLSVLFFAPKPNKGCFRAACTLEVALLVAYGMLDGDYGSIFLVV